MHSAYESNDLGWAALGSVSSHASGVLQKGLALTGATQPYSTFFSSSILASPGMFSWQWQRATAAESILTSPFSGFHASAHQHSPEASHEAKCRVERHFGVKWQRGWEWGGDVQQGWRIGAPNAINPPCPSFVFSVGFVHQ